VGVIEMFKFKNLVLFFVLALMSSAHAMQPKNKASHKRKFDEVSSSDENFDLKKKKVIRFEQFKERLAQENVIVAAADCLEYFFVAADDQEFEQFLLGKSVLPENSVRKKLANKWFRNAAQRVFSDDLRSFLELVVNACDASLPAHMSVGKFGMGFLSILSLLDLPETNGCELEIITSSLSDENIETYGMVFSKHENRVVIRFKDWHTEPTGQAGTTVTLRPRAGAFSQAMLEKVRSYVYAMKFYEHVQVNLNFEGKAEIVNPGVQPMVPQINVTLNKSSLSVSDCGTGIPLDVALLKLPIPSSSTKSIKSLEELRKQCRQQSVKVPYLVRRLPHDPYGASESRLFMTVNGVVVIDRPMPTVLDADGTIKDLVLELPQAMQLTLARDDFSIGTDGSSFEEEQIKRLIDAALDDVMEKRVGVDPRLLSTLFYGLRAWEESSAAQHIKGRFSGYLRFALEDRLLRNEKIIPVPLSTACYLEKIIAALDIEPEYSFVALPENLINHNFGRLEDLLHEYLLGQVQHNPVAFDALAGKLIQGQRVYFVHDDFLPTTPSGNAVINSLGLKGTIFAPQSMLMPTKEKTCQQLLAHAGDCVLRAEDDNDYPLPPLLISTFTDELRLKLSNGAHYLDCSTYDFLKDLKLNDKALYQTDDFPVLISILPLSSKMCFVKGKVNSSSSSCDYPRWQTAIVNRYDPIPNILLINQLFKGYLKSFVEIGFPLSVSKFSKEKYECYPQRHHELPEWWKDTFFCNSSPNEFVKRSGTFEANNRFEAFQSKRKCRLYKPLHIEDEKILEYDHQTSSKKFFSKFNEHVSASHESIEVTEEDLKDLKLYRLLYPFQCSQPAHGELSMVLQNEIKQFSKNLPELDLIRFMILFNVMIMREAQKIGLEYDKSFMFVHNLIEAGCIALDDPVLKLINYIPAENGGRSFPVQKFSSPLILCQKNADVQAIMRALSGQGKKLARHLVTLQAAIDGINNIFISFFQAYQLEQLSKDRLVVTKSCLDSMLATFYGCYDNYLNIDNNEFRRTYGESKKDIACLSTHDITTDEFMDCITLLEADHALLRKMSVFQNNDFALQTSNENRKKDLLYNRFYLPTLLNNTPCSLLARLLQQTGSSDLVQEIARLAISPEELSFIVHLLLCEKNLELIKQLQPADQVKHVRYLVEEFIRSRVSPEEVQATYQENRTCLDLQGRLACIENKIIALTVADYLAQVTGQQNLFAQQQQLCASDLNEALSLAPEWRLSKLMRAHTQGTGIEQDLYNGDIPAVNEKVKNIEEPLDVGKIRQAVEAGSEKNPVEASVIEALQNSVDAVKGFLASLEHQDASAHASLQKRDQAMSDQNPLDQIRTIEYELVRVSGNCADQEQMGLTIADYVGMPGLETILTNLMLPDYSDKSRAQGNVGDMGNGTFNLYKDATEVVFVTRSVRNPEKVFALKVTPIRDEDNLVYDLILQSADVSGCGTLVNFFGTKINVLFRPEEREKNSFKLFATRNFLLNCCGATNATACYQGEQKKIDVVLKTLQGVQVINEPDKIIYADNFALAFQRPALLQSYITTNGVPFRPLADVAKQLKLLPRNLLALMQDGVVIDLPLGIYEPVQSRTQLKMSDDNKHYFARFMQEIAFRSGLVRAQHDDQLLDLYFTHYLSSAEFSQLKPSASGFDELNKAFKSGDLLVSCGTFFRYYQSLDGIMQPFYNKIFFIDRDFVQPHTEMYRKMANHALEVWPQQNDVMSCQSDDEKRSFRAAWLQFVQEQVEPLNDQLEQEFEQYQKDIHARVKDFDDQILWNIALKWFKKKFGTTIKIIPTLNNLLAQFPHLKTSDELEKEKQLGKKASKINNYGFKVAKRLHAYIDCYCKLVVPGIPGKFYAETGKTLGFWDGTEIQINLSQCSISAHLKLMRKLALGQLESIPEDAAYCELFAPQMGAALTVVHELEHAARHSLHADGGAHDDGIDINGKHATFDACATARVRRAVQDGLLKKWSDSVKNYFSGKDKNAKSLKFYKKYNPEKLQEQTRMFETMEQENLKHAIKDLDYAIPKIEELERECAGDKHELAMVILKSA